MKCPNSVNHTDRWLTLKISLGLLRTEPTFYLFVGSRFILWDYWHPVFDGFGRGGMNLHFFVTAATGVSDCWDWSSNPNRILLICSPARTIMAMPSVCSGWPCYLMFIHDYQTRTLGKQVYWPPQFIRLVWLTSRKSTWNLSVSTESLSMQNKRSPVVNGQTAVPSSSLQWRADH